MFHPLYFRCCRSCGLNEIAGLGVLFLREQVRDMRVQEFLRELVVSVVTLSDLAGSIILKKFHCGEGGT